MANNNFARKCSIAILSHSTRRHFLRDSATGLGAIWLATQGENAWAREERLSNLPNHAANNPLNALQPPLPATAKRVIYLHMIGAPSQLELFDFKPDLKRLDGKECPSEFLEGKRFAFIQGTPKMLGPQYPFNQHGESGAWVSGSTAAFFETR